MSIGDLSYDVDYNISDYEEACKEEELLTELMNDALDDMRRYSSEASSSEDPDDKAYAAAKASEAEHQYHQCEVKLNQVKVKKDKALQYLHATQSVLNDEIKVIEEKLPKYDQSILTFELMGSSQFGGSSATSQLSNLQAKRDEYQENLDQAYSLLNRIDSAINGGGHSPQRKSLRL